MHHKLILQNDAVRFSEAFPIGNGSLGAMVYGNRRELKLSLNRDTLWSGIPGRDKTVHVSKERLEEVREQIRAGRYAEAKALTEASMLGPWTESYISAGFLQIEFDALKRAETGTVQRILHMDTAEAESIVDCQNLRIHTRCISSFQDDVIAARIETDHPGDVRISLKTLTLGEYEKGRQELIFRGVAPLHVEPNYVESSDPIQYEGGMPYQIRVNVITPDGTIQVPEQCLSDQCQSKQFAADSRPEQSIDGRSPVLSITQMTQLLVLISVETGFHGWNQPFASAASLDRVCQERINNALIYSFQKLCERHRSVYAPLYKRVELQIDGLPEISRSFQYGRYLMLSSSYPQRPFTQPGNLQGIWCEDIRPMWSCNWTVNINIEMNYWITGPCRLPECDLPYIEMMKELEEAGRRTARETCGCGGFAVFHNTDIWRQTAPVGGDSKWAYWPMGGVWMAIHLYEHYLFTGDRHYLEQEAYPVLKSAALFCLDWLQEEVDGLLHTLPSTSPENDFLDDAGNPCSISTSSTMDITLIRELLQSFVHAAAILEKQDAAARRAEQAVCRLPDWKIGTYGQLQEWLFDFEEADPGHRHMAHLVGLHPFFQLSPQKTPELSSAAECSLRRRIDRNTFYIGWTESWLICFFARLQQAEEAEKHLRNFLEKCSYPNLMSLHPPLGGQGEWEIFQIDGNFGFTAGIAEMLVQSTPGELFLLPCIPESWACGQVKGLMTRNRILVDLKWRDGRITEGTLLARETCTVLIQSMYEFSLRQSSCEVLRAEKMTGTLGYGICIKLNAGECIEVNGETECPEKTVRKPEV